MTVKVTKKLPPPPPTNFVGARYARKCLTKFYFRIFVTAITSCELFERVMLVSSANGYAFECFRHEWRSVMQMSNNDGPRTDSLGIPDTISLIVETFLLMDKNCCLHFR